MSGGTMAHRQIFVNGKLYTADKESKGTAFVVEEGEFLFVGSDKEARTYAQEGDEVRDLQGARVIPGMMDTHCHFIMMSSLKFDEWAALEFHASHEETLASLKEFAEQHPAEESPIIRGLGYGLNCKTLATELDKAVSDRPAFLLDSGGHSAWVNTKMMELVGLDASTPDPKPGASYFTRDAEGNPTGQVIETEAELFIIEGAGIASPQNIADRLPENIAVLNS